MKAFKNEWTPQVWEGVGPVLPTAVQDALTYYQQLLIMVNAINETRDNQDKLADYTNTELNNIVDYLNERIKDFNIQMNEFFDKTDKAMDKFMKDEVANREAFEAEMEAAFNKFTADITKQWKDFKDKVEQWMDEITGEWGEVQEAWEAVKAAWEQMKKDWEAFRNQMTSEFEQFKEEIRRLFEEYKSQTNEDLADWKLQTFNYFQGQYDSIKAALEAKLPDIVSNKLPEVLAEYAGICLYYDPETRKINVGYDEGLARNGENKLIVTGGGAGGGVTVKAGDGINVEVNEEDHQATVSGKIAQAAEIGMVKVGEGLEISEDGTLKATGGAAGGDTVTAGVGIEIQDVEGNKQISVKKGSATELGAYRVGNGLEVDETGVLQVKRWQPVDTTAAFEFFDKNIQQVGNTLELNFDYDSAIENSKAVYYRMQADSLAQLGLPDTVTVTEWTPDKQWVYDSTPAFRLSTSGLVGNANGAIAISSTNPSGRSPIISPIRNGHGNIVLMWNNKQNTVTLPFVIKGRDFILDQVHPININGTPVGEGDTYSVTTFGNLKITYNLIDGTVVYDSQVFWNGGNPVSYISGTRFDAVVTNKCVQIDKNNGMLTTLNANAGAVAYKINKPYIGMDVANIGPDTVVNFNINYDSVGSDPVIKLSQATTKNFGSSIVGQIQWPGYTGSQFKVSVDNVNIAGLNRFNVDSINVDVGNQFNIIPNRDGEVNIIATPAQYIGATAQSKVVVSLDETMKPHIKITTDSTLVADTQKDIANPATVDVGNLAKFSKGQGIITFWMSCVPGRDYFNDTGATLKIGEITQHYFRPVDQPSFNFDFSQYTVGDKVSIKFDGSAWRGAYEVVFGEVVE